MNGIKAALTCVYFTIVNSEKLSSCSRYHRTERRCELFRTRRGRIALGALIMGITAVMAIAAEEPPVPPPAGEVINVTGVIEPIEPDVLNCGPSLANPLEVDCPTLREAVMYANANRKDLEPTQDTINLPAGTYTLTIAGADETFAACVDGAANPPVVTNTPDASVGDLDITDSLIINGAGPDTTIVEWAVDAVEADRVFHVYDPLLTVFAEFNGIRVSNGMLLEQVLCQGPPTALDPPPAEPLPTLWVGRRAGGGIAVGAVQPTRYLMTRTSLVTRTVLAVAVARSRGTRVARLVAPTSRRSTRS
jgi:hypothetical protein